MSLEIEIDRELCMGSGNCVYHAPATFDLDDESIAVVVDAAGASLDEVTAAATHCPSGAISVRTTDAPDD